MQYNNYSDDFEGVDFEDDLCLNCGDSNYRESSVQGICYDCMTPESLSKESDTRISRVMA